MSRILYVTNIGGKRMSYGFSGTAIEAAHSLGFDFYTIANRSSSSPEDIKEDEQKYGVRLLHYDLARNPFSLRNLKAYKQLCEVIRENKIDYIHCNTPVGGMLGRLAGKKCKVKKVVYQVHGFHFYKGAPKKNWLLYYPIEKWLARYTDALITINREDYEFAKNKLKLRNGGKVHYVPGVGIDTAQFRLDADLRVEKRKELGIPHDAFVLISAGELNANKNNSAIIAALDQLKNNNIHYILCGVGELEADLKKQAADAGLQDRVHFLGYRTDVKELYAMADCFVMPSFREGLSRSIMEAMASGLPCIVSKIRGNTDLVAENEGGFLCKPTDYCGFADAINALASDAQLCQNISEFNRTRVMDFDVAVVEEELRKIYTEMRG